MGRAGTRGGVRGGEKGHNWEEEGQGMGKWEICMRTVSGECDC